MALSDLFVPSLALGTTILSAGSAFARGAGARAIGVRRKAALDFEAEQLEQSAIESRGAGTRVAQQEQIRTQYVNSLAIARAAASGAGASDPTVMAVISRTAGEGAYRAALAMYEGEAQARLDRIRAEALRYEGGLAVSDAGLARQQAEFTGARTIFSDAPNVLSMFEKYWPKPSPTRALDSGAGLPIPIEQMYGP